jgi:hypothetical protein
VALPAMPLLVLSLASPPIEVPRFHDPGS